VCQNPLVPVLDAGPQKKQALSIRCLYGWF